MKKMWSSDWIASTQPRKQRKYRYNAPLHIRRKFLSAHLSKELREKFGKRSVGVRKGDEVIVMKGEFRGFKGNVDRVDTSKSRVFVDGMKRKKVDGSEVSVSIHASNVMITKLTLDDKMRQAIFERTGPRAEKPKAEKETKPSKAKPERAAAEPKPKKPKAEKASRKKEGAATDRQRWNEGDKSRLPTESAVKPPSTSDEDSPSVKKEKPAEHHVHHEHGEKDW